MLLLLAPWLTLPAAAFEYRIAGVGGELRDNVRAHLGAPPASGLAIARALEAAPGRVRDALQALGHYHARVTLEERGAGGDPLPAGAPTSDVARLHIHIEPGEPVRLRTVAIELLGPGQSDPALTAFVAGAPLEAGDPLHHGVYSRFKRELQSLVRARGYFDSALEAHRLRIDVAARAADITLRLATGPRYAFGRLRHDEAQLDRERLASLAPFATGDPFTQEDLQRLRSRLLATGFFGGVSVIPRIDERADGRVPVTVELLPAPAHSFEFGVGFRTDTRGRVSALWRSPRLNRAGHSQETRLRWSPVNPGGSVVYRIPGGDRLRDNLQLRASVENNRFGDLDSLQQEIGARYEYLAGDWVVSAGVRALREDWSVLAEEFTADYLLPGATLARRVRVGGVVDPSSGFSQFYSVEAAGKALGSASDLLRLYGTWRWIGGPGAPHRLVARLELGALLGGSEPPQTRAPSLGFYAGGDQSIRGYDYQSIGYQVAYGPGAPGTPGSVTVGGDRLLTGSFEYQHYLRDKWRLAAFVDGGDAFVDDKLDLKVGVGVGVHYLTPVGALKLELANSISEANPDWRIHINIGAEL